MNISKKLLEVVLGEDYNPRLVETIEIEDNMLCTYYEGKHRYLGLEINIYELLDMCKKWLVSKEILFTVRYQLLFIKGEDVLQVTCILNESYEDGFYNYEEEFNGDTELEVMIKACKYALNNLKKEKK